MIRIYITSVICIFTLLSLQAKAQSNFPERWIGVYTGNLYISNPQEGITDTIPVTFELLETALPNRWTYRFTYQYSNTRNIVKDYELCWHDSLQSPNHFLLDEKDGIYLDQYFLNNRFYGQFQIGTHVFTSILQPDGKGLYFEIQCADMNGGTFSKSKSDKDGKSDEIQNTYIYSLQYVHLKRSKKP